MHRITPSAAAIPAQVSDVCSLNWLLQPVTSNCQHSSSTSHAHRASWGTHEHRDLARHVRSRSLWPLQSAELAILLMCVAWPSDSPSSFFGRCFHSIAECGFICLPVERILAAQSLQPMHSPWPAGPEQLQRMRPATHLLCPKDSGTAATLTHASKPSAEVCHAALLTAAESTAHWSWRASFAPLHPPEPSTASRTVARHLQLQKCLLESSQSCTPFARLESSKSSFQRFSSQKSACQNSSDFEIHIEFLAAQQSSSAFKAVTMLECLD